MSILRRISLLILSMFSSNIFCGSLCCITLFSIRYKHPKFDPPKKKTLTMLISLSFLDIIKHILVSHKVVVVEPLMWTEHYVSENSFLVINISSRCLPICDISRNKCANSSTDEIWYQDKLAIRVSSAYQVELKNKRLGKIKFFRSFTGFISPNEKQKFFNRFTPIKADKSH